MKIKSFLIAEFFLKVIFLLLLSVLIIGNSYKGGALSSSIGKNEGGYFLFIIILSLFVFMFIFMNFNLSVKYYKKKKIILFYLSSLLLSISTFYFISGVILPFLNSGTETAIMGSLASIFSVYIYIFIVRLFTFGGGYAKYVPEKYSVRLRGVLPLNFDEFYENVLPKKEALPRRERRRKK